MNKRLEIIIKGDEAYNPETLREIARGNFSIEIVSPPPVPILSKDPAFGALRSGIVGYRASPEPPAVYLTIGEGERKRIGYRLRRAARDLIEYRRRKGISGDLEELDRIHELELSLEEGETQAPEGEGRGDRLIRAAREIDRVLGDAVKKNTGIETGYFSGVSINDIMIIIEKALEEGEDRSG